MVKLKLQPADRIFYIENEGTVWGPWEVGKVQNGKVTALIGNGVQLDIPVKQIRKANA